MFFESFDNLRVGGGIGTLANAAEINLRLETDRFHTSVPKADGRAVFLVVEYIECSHVVGLFRQQRSYLCYGVFILP